MRSRTRVHRRFCGVIGVALGADFVNGECLDGLNRGGKSFLLKAAQPFVVVSEFGSEVLRNVRVVEYREQDDLAHAAHAEERADS